MIGKRARLRAIAEEVVVLWLEETKPLADARKEIPPEVLSHCLAKVCERHELTETEMKRVLTLMKPALDNISKVVDGLARADREATRK